MNMWSLRYMSEILEIEITLLVKCKDLTSCISLAKAIEQKDNMKLLGICQVWVDKEFKEDRK